MRIRKIGTNSRNPYKSLLDKLGDICIVITNKTI